MQLKYGWKFRFLRSTSYCFQVYELSRCNFFFAPNSVRKKIRFLLKSNKQNFLELNNWLRFGQVRWEDRENEISHNFLWSPRIYRLQQLDWFQVTFSDYFKQAINFVPSHFT